MPDATSYHCGHCQAKKKKWKTIINLISCILATQWHLLLLLLLTTLATWWCPLLPLLPIVSCCHPCPCHIVSWWQWWYCNMLPDKIASCAGKTKWRKAKILTCEASSIQFAADKKQKQWTCETKMKTKTNNQQTKKKRKQTNHPVQCRGQVIQQPHGCTACACKMQHAIKHTYKACNKACNIKRAIQHAIQHAIPGTYLGVGPQQRLPSLRPRALLHRPTTCMCVKRELSPPISHILVVGNLFIDLIKWREPVTLFNGKMHWWLSLLVVLVGVLLFHYGMPYI